MRLLLVDDAAATRRLLCAVIDCVPTLEVVAQAVNGRQALEMTKELQPDVVLLDLSLPDADGAELLPYLLDCAPQCRVVILSNSARSVGPNLVAEGASGYIEKGLGPGELIAKLSRAIDTPLARRGLLAHHLNREFAKP